VGDLRGLHGGIKAREITKPARQACRDSRCRNPERPMLKFRKNMLVAAGLSAVVSLGAQAESKTEFDVCWTIYAGWMPWDYAESSGIMDKWADKYGIKVNLVQLNDYVESINQYTAGEFDACTITN